MSEHAFECLSAFLDGESVDPSELAAALSMPGAREALVDFIRLRAEIGRDESTPSRRFYRTMERIVTPESHRRRSYAIGGGMAFAAALLVIAVLLWTAPMRRHLSVGDDAARLNPPNPTREIRFERGVDWEFRSTSTKEDWR
jgi:hypothetical protein